GAAHGPAAGDAREPQRPGDRCAAAARPVDPVALMATPRLRIASVAVAYGDTRVLDGVDLDVGAGEVHALLGENGAGKSTLLKALVGAVPICGGRLEVDGEAFLPRDPLHAARCGIAMIHQELSVLPHLSVADNIMLGRECQRFGVVDRGARDGRAAAALAL